MGELPEFSYTALHEWIDEKLDKQNKACGMGWIDAVNIHCPPETDVPTEPSSHTFMRMQLGGWCCAPC